MMRSLIAKLYPVAPPEAYLADYRNAPGYYFTGDAYYEGENRPFGGQFSYFVSVDSSGDEDKKDSILIEILDGEMNLVRTLKSVPENGLNRTTWRLDRKGVRVSFSAEKPKSGGDEQGSGGSVLPGTYKVRMSYRGDTAFTSIEVKPDPRSPYDMAGMQAKQEKTDQLLAKMEELNLSLSSIRECREGFELVKKLAGDESTEILSPVSKPMEEKLKILEKEFFRDETIQGIYYPSDALYVKFSETYGILGADKPLTGNQLIKFSALISLADDAISRTRQFMEGEWLEYREAVLREEISLLKE